MFESLIGVICLTLVCFVLVGVTGKILFGK